MACASNKSNMNRDQIKSLLIRDKDFLKSLYESNSVARAKNVLSFASDQKLNTLIRFLHLLASGEIKIKKEHFDALKKRHLNAVNKNLESKKMLRTLLNGEREVKLQVLTKFCAVFRELLFTLFNQIIEK